MAHCLKDGFGGCHNGPIHIIVIKDVTHNRTSNMACTCVLSDGTTPKQMILKTSH
jgi:hypothetical protein